MDIVLASGSPRRRELLEGLGWRFRVVFPNIDETPRQGESPEDLCVRLAAAKAKAAAGGENETSLIVAADTIVVIDGDVLGKPADKTESLKMIARLQGRTHQVLTGLGVMRKGHLLLAWERTRVRFRPLGEEALRAYVETGEGMDKAGAYAVQGKGALLVSSIEGDYFNVVGLPLCRLGLMIEELGLDLTLQWGG
jgi:septum formation protein